MDTAIKYEESVARHGNLSAQEYPSNKQDVIQQSTLVLLEDNVPRMKFDSMMIGTIEMELIEVYDIHNNYHHVKLHH